MENNIVKKDQNQVLAKQEITPMAMLQIAMEQGADIDKMQQLMDLQERWESNQARKAYVEAMAKFREDCPIIEKSKKGHNSKYAGLAETIQQIKFHLSDHGLSHSWKTDQISNETKVTCTVTHILGHTESTSLAAPAETSGSKNNIQAIGSTISYLERYTLFAILGLASSDMDTDGAIPQSIEYVSDVQAQEIINLIDEVKADEAKFLKHMQIPSVEHLRATEYPRAKKLLEMKRGKK